jgi:hypothetical protein
MQSSQSAGRLAQLAEGRAGQNRRRIVILSFFAGVLVTAFSFHTAAMLQLRFVATTVGWAGAPDGLRAAPQPIAH